MWLKSLSYLKQDLFDEVLQRDYQNTRDVEENMHYIKTSVQRASTDGSHCGNMFWSNDENPNKMQWNLGL